MAEDADFGPVWVVSWSACAEVEVGRVGEMVSAAGASTVRSPSNATVPRCWRTLLLDGADPVLAGCR